MSRENFLLVDTEIQALLDKGVIKMVDLGEDKYLSSIFLAEKERFKPEPSHQCEKHEPACPLRTFQNVGIIFFKRAPEKSGFSMQSELERCILCCCITQSIREFCIFRVERQNISICLPLFRLGSGPSSFYKVDGNFNSRHKDLEWEDFNLPGQYLDNNSVQERVIGTKAYSHFSPPELGLRHQLQKLCVRPMPCVAMSGTGNRFST